MSIDVMAAQYVLCKIIDYRFDQGVIIIKEQFVFFYEKTLYIIDNHAVS